VNIRCAQKFSGVNFMVLAKAILFFRPGPKAPQAAIDSVPIIIVYGEPCDDVVMPG
jgi:hypothetical protein